MMKLNLQFFAHKKGVGSTKNGRDSESKSVINFIGKLTFDIAFTLITLCNHMLIRQHFDCFRYRSGAGKKQKSHRLQVQEKDRLSQEKRS